MKRGDVVLVRAYRGEPLIRRVVDIDNSGVLVCRQETWQQAELHGYEEFPAAGFPQSDVFTYNLGLYQLLQRAFISGDTTSIERIWDQAQR